MQQQQARKKLTFEPMTPQKIGGNDWQVQVVVTLSEGQDIIDGVDIIFYVNGVPEVDGVVTDVNGRAQKLINLPQGPRQFTVTAQVQGMAVSATSQVSLPREEIPAIELDVATPQKVGADWQSLATIIVTRNQQPFGGAPVQIFIGGQLQGQPLQTNPQGRAQTALTFPATGGMINVAAQVVNTAAYVNMVVTIPLPVKKTPHRLEVKADGSLGLYTIHVIVVDENGRGVKSSLRFYSLRGASDPKNGIYEDYKDVETDDNGVMSFPIQFDVKETEVGIIILGTAIDTKVNLSGPKSFKLPVLDTEAGIVVSRTAIDAKVILAGSKDVKLPALDLTPPKKSWWGMIKDGWNTGSQQIKEEKDKRRGQK